MRPRASSSWLHAARFAVVVVVAVVAFAVSVPLAVVLHLNLPATRRLVASQGSSILAGVLRGSVEIERIGYLGIDGIDGVRVRVLDPTGVQVVDASGVGARMDTRELVRSLFTKGPIRIPVRRVTVESADVNLDPDAAGDLRIGSAFAGRTNEATGTLPPPPKAPDARGILVETPSLAIAHAWVHRAGPQLDVDLTGLAGRARVDTTGPGSLNAELDRVSVFSRGMLRALDPRGALGARLEMPLDGGLPRAGGVTFEGDVGGMATSIEGTLSGRELRARIDTFDETGARARSMTETAIRDELSIHAAITGELGNMPGAAHHLEGTASVLLGAASAELRGRVTLADVTTVDGWLHARHLNLAGVLPGAPPSNVGVDARASVTFDARGPDGVAAVETTPSSIAGNALPPVFAVGHFAHDRTSVRLRTSDPAMPVEAVVDLGPRPDGRAGQLALAAVRASVPDLRRLPVPLGGAVQVEATGRLTLPEQEVNADATVVARHLLHPSAKIDELRAESHLEGSTALPKLQAAIHARGLAVGRVTLASLDARAGLERDRRTGDLVVHDAEVEASRDAGEKQVAVAVRRLVLGTSNARVVVEDAVVNGVGEPIRGSARYDGRRGHEQIDAKVDAPRIDLAEVARLAGKPDAIACGNLAIAADGQLVDGGSHGRLHLELSDLAAKSIKGGHAVVDANVEDHRLGLEVHAELGDTGKVSLRTDRLTLAGPTSNPASWRTLHGRASLEGEVALGKLRELLPDGVIPLAELDGTLSVQGRLGRDSATAPPEIALALQTNGLVVSGPSEMTTQVAGVGVRSTSRWRTAGVDVGVEFKNDGTSGFTNVSARATDRYGVIVSMDAKTTIPYADVIGDHGREALREQLLSAPLAVKVDVPARRLDQLPPTLGLSSGTGVIDGDLEVSGSAGDPRVHLVAHGRKVRTDLIRALVVDSDVALDYDGTAAALAVAVRRDKTPILDLTTRVEASARDFIAAQTKNGAAPLPDWRGSAKLRFAGIPLDVVPLTGDRRLKGTVRGEVTLDDLHHDARAKAQLDFDKLGVGRTKYKSGTVTVDAEGGKLVATARVEQEKGYFDARAATRLTWGSALVPKLDANRAIARVSAKDFSVKVVQPFLPEAIPVLDGLLDAQAKATLREGKTRFDGKVAFKGGRMQLTALGEELRDVRANATFTPDGKVTVRDLSAHGPRGEVHGSADAQLDGVRLVDASASVDIPKRHALDVAFQGQPLGSVFGSIRIKAQSSADQKRTTLAIDVPKLGVELPQVTKTGVQSVDDDDRKKKEIKVGVYRGPATFTELPLSKEDTRKNESSKERAKEEASRLDIAVNLGAVTISRGNSARVVVAGNPKVSVTSDDDSGGTTITGELHTTTGWVDVQGKRFEIDRASVVFNGESPPNPIITATAQWEAADATKVYVDFVGPVKTGKVTMRSEPPLSKDEILSLVVFGTTEGANPSGSGGSSQSGATSAALGVGGGIAAQGLTQALDDLAGIQATARIDTTMANNPKPEVEVQVSPKVTIGYAHVVGNPPITQPDINLGKFQWRFHARWSLETTVGDRGTAMFDAIWQKRY